MWPEQSLGRRVIRVKAEGQWAGWCGHIEDRDLKNLGFHSEWGDQSHMGVYPGAGMKMLLCADDRGKEGRRREHRDGGCCHRPR